MYLKKGLLLQGDKYKIERVLGQGGFGITYLAEQTSLGRKVAIKEFFMKELCNRDETTSHVSVGSEGSREMVTKFRDKFVKEARNIASLEHPNIVSVIDVFEENGTAYYVMKYCEGGSLAELLKTQYPSGMPEAMALKYIREVASALDYIHKRSINHLDVKPSNIMLNESGNAVLIDFGLSKQYDTETGQQTSSTPVGISEGYAPMEQYKKGGVGKFSPSTDIYSLGATLYKLITGTTPPGALDLGVEPLPEFMATSHVKKAVCSAMQTRSTDRPQSVSAFLSVLEGDSEDTYIDPEPASKLTHKPSPAPAPLPKPLLKFKPIIFGFIAVAAIVLSILYFGRNGKVEDSIPPTPNTDTEDIINVLEEEPEQISTTNACDSTTGTHRGHNWVDLGLPSGTKWATTNVGASSPSDYGSYFAWGETSPKSSYSWDNLEYCLDTTGNKFSKYVIGRKFGNLDGKKELDLSDDAAYVNWGSGWRMPSQSQLEELKSKCIYTKTSMNGKFGYKFTSKKNGNFIFLPFAGYKYESRSVKVDSLGHYWSREKSSSGSYDECAIDLEFGSGWFSTYIVGRSCGNSVRPVLDN